MCENCLILTDLDMLISRIVISRNDFSATWRSYRRQSRRLHFPEYRSGRQRKLKGITVLHSSAGVSECVMGQWKDRHDKNGVTTYGPGSTLLGKNQSPDYSAGEVIINHRRRPPTPRGGKRRLAKNGSHARTLGGFVL